MKIKKGDLVKVIAGKTAAETSLAEQSPRRVTQVLDGGRLVVVEGVNLVYKHVRRGHPRSPQGGRLRLEKPINSSNVQYFCESCNSLAKLGFRYLEDGTKERHCKKCSASAGKISPPRPRYAKS